MSLQSEVGLRGVWVRVRRARGAWEDDVRGPTCRIMLAALLSIKTDTLLAVVCVYVISFLKTTDKKKKTLS